MKPNTKGLVTQQLKDVFQVQDFMSNRDVLVQEEGEFPQLVKTTGIKGQPQENILLPWHLNCLFVLIPSGMPTVRKKLTLLFRKM